MISDYSEKFGSFERFNRVLYGGHSKDDSQNRFFTFAGDTPIFMGASSDYTKDTWCYQAKNGVLISGLAMTPGHVEGNSRDIFSLWFHNSPDILAKWHHGYMSYELSGISAYFPDVRIKIEVYPLFPEDGYVVHYDITTDQRVIFCAGMGGITPFFGRFEYHHSAGRNFCLDDCSGNRAEISESHGFIAGAEDTVMRIAADFDCEYSLDSAAAMVEKHPAMFLAGHGGENQIVKLRRNLEAGEHFTGNIIVMRNGSWEELQNYLKMPDICSFLRGEIRKKYASVAFNTPDKLLNDTVTDTIIAEDAAFHGRSFYHGAIGYHAPFLGWRGWYAPALLGWAERVKAAIKSHFDTITKPNGEEKVWWDGGDRPDLDHEGTQYHHIENSPGHLTALLHRDDIYDMQEVAVDMTLYYLEHAGDLETCSEIYDRLCEILDWEERILDPDGDGLYQNFLNTWISDGHSYNGANCAQASSYNYAANIRTAALGRRLNKDVSKLEKRAAKIQKAFQEKIWQNVKGIPAESIDTIGNKLVHDTPELSTIYLAADCGNTNFVQTWRMLNWAERNIKSVTTAGRGGKLRFSSNWLPKKYSSCGIFPAENACLALTYFQNGQPEKAMEIVNGLTDGFLLSPHPGSLQHIFTALGGADAGDIDFTDVSSCYLRLLIEGLWGVRFNLGQDKITLAPQLPDEWEGASISLPDVSLTICREKLSDMLTVSTKHSAVKTVKLPLRFAGIDRIYVNGVETDYEIIPGIGRSFAEFTTGENIFTVSIYYRDIAYPVLKENTLRTFSGNLEAVEVMGGTVQEMSDFAGVLKAEGDYFRISAEPGVYDVLFTVKTGETPVYLPLTVEVLSTERKKPLLYSGTETVDIAGYFNTALTEIHNQEFRSPRPEGYSIGMRLNGRYAWEWNHCGHNALNVDDTRLRTAGGVIKPPSGIPFATPGSGNNCLSVSIWDNFPATAEIPLSGKARGLALLICGTTNAMQSHVVNGRITVNYADATAETVELIPPYNFDDFLVAAFQMENETVYFSEVTHGMVQKIALDPAKELKSLSMEAVANEVIVNLLGVTLLK